MALKKVLIRKSEDGVPKEFIREVESLQRVLHENVVTINEIFIGRTNINLVYPYCETDLEQLITNSQKPFTIP